MEERRRRGCIGASPRDRNNFCHDRERDRLIGSKRERKKEIWERENERERESE